MRKCGSSRRRETMVPRRATKAPRRLRLGASMALATLLLLGGVAAAFADPGVIGAPIPVGTGPIGVAVDETTNCVIRRQLPQRLCERD